MPYTTTHHRLTPKGSFVTVVAEHGEVLIVENERRTRHSISAVSLTNEQPPETITEAIEIINLRNVMVAECKKSKPKFKVLVQAVESGMLNKSMPDGITKEQWLLTAKEIINGN